MLPEPPNTLYSKYVYIYLYTRFESINVKNSRNVTFSKSYRLKFLELINNFHSILIMGKFSHTYGIHMYYHRFRQSYIDYLFNYESIQNNNNNK